jgi:hypothetical protein
MICYGDYLYLPVKGSNFAYQILKAMTEDQIRQIIQGGEWVSITPEVRPSIVKDANGNLKPFYCSRLFRYSDGDRFELELTNFADANGKVPLVKMGIKGRIHFDSEHPIAPGAYNLDYVADEAFTITPLHQGFADALKLELNVAIDVLGKDVPAFGLKAGEYFKEFDLVYIYNNMLFNGSRNIDGRGFDTPENRPTNLQIPLIRKA